MPFDGGISAKNEFSTLKLGSKDIFSIFAKSKMNGLFLFLTSDDAK